MVALPLKNVSPIPQRIGTVWIPPNEQRNLPLSVVTKYLTDKRFELNTDDLDSILIPSGGDNGLQGFSFMSPISLADGYGQGGIFMALGADMLGVDVDLYSAGWLERQQLPDRLKFLLYDKSKVGYNTGVARGYPDQILTRIPAKYKIANTMWECDRIRPDWVPLINDSVALIVPCRSVGEIFRNSGVRVPMHYVPEPVDTEYWSSVPHVPNPNVFKIVSWSRMSSRKMPMEMLQVFSYTFPRERYPDVIFELKTYGGQFGVGTGIIPTIDDPRIRIYDGVWSLDKLRSWVQDAHCGFFLSRGEGMFVPPMQAMAMGIPVIVPNHSGPADYADRRYNYPVKLARPQFVPSPMGDNMQWWNPSLEDASDQLLALYTNYEEAKKRGTAAKEMIQRRYSVPVVGAKLVKVVERYV